MAFLTRADIASQINSTDTALIESELLICEAQLTNLGFIFEDKEGNETRWITGTRDNVRHIFDFGFVYNVESVMITESHKDDGDILTANDAYTLVAVRNAPTTFWRIELTQGIEYPYAIRIVGEFGLYIDFTSNDIGPRLLRNAIISYINARIIYLDNQAIRYRNITRAKTGDSDITYGSHDEQSVANIVESIYQNTEMMQAIRHYIDV
jgi:hypothetical protein